MFRSSLPLVEEDASVFCSSPRRVEVDASVFPISPACVSEDASARRETDVSRSAEVEQPSAAGVDDTPTVETTEEIGLNVRRFHVDTVVDSGSACPSIGRMSPEGASGSDGR